MKVLKSLLLIICVTCQLQAQDNDCLNAINNDAEVVFTRNKLGRQRINSAFADLARR